MKIQRRALGESYDDFQLLGGGEWKINIITTASKYIPQDPLSQALYWSALYAALRFRTYEKQDGIDRSSVGSFWCWHLTKIRLMEMGM